MTFLEFCKQHNVYLTKNQELIANAAIPELEKVAGIGGGKTFLLNLLDLYIDFRFAPSLETDAILFCNLANCKGHYHVGTRK